MTVDVPRPSPYIWVTWLAAELSGDAHCAYKAWYKAHHRYAKRPQVDENALSVWKAQHAEMVRKRVAWGLETGYADAVTVEEQNKFAVRGQSATVGGVIDIVWQKGNWLGVEDCKTGERRDSDFWQVATYMVLLPLHGLRRGVDLMRELASGEARLSGSVLYADGSLRCVELGQAGRRAVNLDGPMAANGSVEREMIFAKIREIGSGPEPRRTPSLAECSRCDILHCPERYAAEPRDVTTGEF